MLENVKHLIHHDRTNTLNVILSSLRNLGYNVTYQIINARNFGVHPTLPSQETSGRFFIYIPEKDLVRKLTIGECYRIMGFPETFKIHPSLGESYKQIGNSVCVPMVEAIAKSILNQNLLSNQPNEPQTKIPEYKQLVLFKY